MNKILAKSTVFLKRNSATILTCVGAVGVIATPIIAVRATPKASMLLEEAREEKGEDLTTIEKVKVAGPVYIPSILLGASTLACVFGANILNKRTQASLISAYTMLNRSYSEYKKKVGEIHGEEADREIKIAVANDKHVKDFHTEEEEIKLFFDDISGRYFESSLADVVLAEYHFNRNFILKGEATLNDLYEWYGLDPIPAGDVLGWSHEAGNVFYGYSWVDFDHDKVTLEDGMECYIISMPFMPTADFNNLYGDE